MNRLSTFFPQLGLSVLVLGLLFSLRVPVQANTNPGDRPIGDLFGLEPGSTAVAPPPIEGDTGSVGATPATNGALRTHTVVAGDTLSKLAQQYCGDSNQWKNIYAANRHSIRDPHWIYPGQKFYIACNAGETFATADGTAWSQTTQGAEMIEQAGGQGPRDGSVITHMPLPRGEFRVSSHFGPRNCTGCSRNHKGIDLAASSGTPIAAVGAGRVIRANFSESYGNVIEIQHADGTITRYAHMKNNSMQVRVGDTVAGGQQIGQVGSTGQSTGPHLHLELLSPSRVAMNPAPALNLA